MFAQIGDSALETGFWGLRPQRQAPAKRASKIGHSLTHEMGLNPSFFKAGAGGGEV